MQPWVWFPTWKNTNKKDRNVDLVSWFGKTQSMVGWPVTLGPLVRQNIMAGRAWWNENAYFMGAKMQTGKKEGA